MYPVWIAYVHVRAILTNDGCSKKWSGTTRYLSYPSMFTSVHLLPIILGAAKWLDQRYCTTRDESLPICSPQAFIHHS